MSSPTTRIDPNRKYFGELVLLDHLVTKYLLFGSTVDSFKYDHANQSWKPVLAVKGTLGLVHRFNNCYCLAVHNLAEQKHFMLRVTVHLETMVQGNNLLVKRLDNHDIYRFRFEDPSRLFKFDMNVMLLIQHLKMANMLMGFAYNEAVTDDMIKVYFVLGAKAKHCLENANRANSTEGGCAIPLEWQTHRRSLDIQTFLLLNEQHSGRWSLPAHIGRGLSDLFSMFSRNRSGALDLHAPEFFLSTQGINTLNALLQYLRNIEGPSAPGGAPSAMKPSHSKTSLPVPSVPIPIFGMSRESSHYSLVVDDTDNREKEEDVLASLMAALTIESPPGGNLVS